jgi:hypothetical protein
MIDPAVVSKCPDVGTFGNDTVVVSKSGACAAFSNYTAMFIRVRRRVLGGQRHHGYVVKASASYDVVRAVRINGKPRQKFLLGLGSIKELATPSKQTAHDLMWFWVHAVLRMRRHGLSDEQQRRLIEALARKGVRKPSIDECTCFAEGWRTSTLFSTAAQELGNIIAGGPAL